MADSKKPSGCGVLHLYTSLFRRRGRTLRRHRRCSSTSSLAEPSTSPTRRRTESADSLLALRPVNPPKSNLNPTRQTTQALLGPAKKPTPGPGNGLSGELESFLFDFQKTKGSTTLVRATSGNVMVHGNLGNIRPNRSSYNDLKSGFGSMGNPVVTGAVAKKMDAEELKEMGNKEFKKGRFTEALEFYDRAIGLDPGAAPYRSNKAAALTGLGRVLEAVAECKEAVRIDPGYCRAHNRLAGLYFRLGEANKAFHHYKLSRNEASPGDISRAQDLQSLVARCDEAQRAKDWNTVLKESQSAISMGVDSAPQVFAWQAEALMNLNKHEEADAVFNGAPNFNIDSPMNIFGATVNAYVLKIRTQVDMAAGRFDEAALTAQKAAQLDANNREISTLVKRTRAVASARSKGNDLFKALRFREACLAYGEGLDHDPQNAILLCNRAASRSKLGQWEKAIEDCNAALSLRPSYTKARLRRADCNAKLGRWEASIQDYELLSKEIPEDEEVAKAFMEAKSQLRKQRG